MMSDLQTRLEQIDHDTIDGNTAYATITEISDNHRGNIRLEVQLPSGRRHAEWFELPETHSDSYEFVRLLEGMGYGLVTATEAVGDSLQVEFHEDGPTIVVPERERTVKNMFKEFGSLFSRKHISLVLLPGVLLTWPLTGMSIFPKWHQEYWNTTPDSNDWFMEYFILGYSVTLCAWVSVFTLFTIMTEITIAF